MIKLLGNSVHDLNHRKHFLEIISYIIQHLSKNMHIEDPTCRFLEEREFKSVLQIICCL